MKKSTACRLAGLAMLVCAALFVVFAFHNPQAGFPWSNAVTYGIYGIYLAVMLLLLVAPSRKR